MHAGRNHATGGTSVGEDVIDRRMKMLNVSEA
jgi:hypothetical protein